jgi:hypothetical protein
MRRTYQVLAYLIAAGVVVQAAAIAYAWFTVLHQLDGGAVIDESYDGNGGHALHGIVGGMVIPALALLLLASSFFARFPSATRWALGVFGLVALQYLLAALSFAVPALGALHGLNALAVFAVAALAGRRVYRAGSMSRPETSTLTPA